MRSRRTLAWLGLVAACGDGPGAPTPTELARDHVVRRARAAGIADHALPVLDAAGEIAVAGGSIVRLRQVIDGLPVWGGELRVLVGPAGRLAHAAGEVVDTKRSRSAPRFVDDEPRAVAKAIGAGVLERALARRVWYPEGETLIAAWVVDAYTSPPGSTIGDAHRTFIAGDDGRVLERYSLVADAAFGYQVFADPADKHPYDSPLVDALPHPAGAPDGSFPAYRAGPSLVTVDSLNALGDPWLDAGATTTRGNNVDAYADFNAPSGLTSGDFRATANGGVFDHVYDTSQGPLVSQQQQMAAITSLFYVINWLHDFWYNAGFTEAAGNGQAQNFGRGGIEGDAMLAEAQDNALGGSRNNANMATPDDGMPPRMQVFLWNGKDTRTMTLQPSGRTPKLGGAAFGPTDFDVTAPVALGDDGAGASSTDGCEPLVAPVTGRIVAVDRGNCTFKRKTLHVQDAGGAGVIIINNTSSASPPTLGDDANITQSIIIPAVSITDVEGAALRAELAAGPTSVRIQRAVSHELDGALDATLIAHEFGHYLHHRLSLCTNTMCRAQSEGWGDFIALMLLARPGDDLTGAFPFSVYVTQSYPNDPGYFGIRRAPYSVDPAINALSYRHMADGEQLPTEHPFAPSSNNAEVHNAGEVWASALWEGYVALQQAGTSFDEVRAKMARYVVAGLLLAPPQATPMQTRDALLAAVRAASPADHAILLAAFARRGFGSCAVAPPPARVDFVGLVESKVIAGRAELTDKSVTDSCDADGVLDGGESATLALRVANRGHAPLTDLVMTVTSAVPGLSISSPPVPLARLEPEETAELSIAVALAPGSSEAIAGDLALHISAAGGCATEIVIPLAARFNVDDRDASSTTDTFDTAQSGWVPWATAWTHVRETPLDGAWHGEARQTAGDARLTSPYLEASATEPLVVTFDHRYVFEVGSGTAWDGGVIEYSVGTDEVWQDIAALAQPGYTAVLGTGNPLAGRMAFTGQSLSYPAMDRVTLDLGTALAGQTFRVRFRLGTDSGGATEGWLVDDVGFSEIVGTPFPAQIPDSGNCTGEPEPPPDLDDPIRAGGGGGCAAADGGAGAGRGGAIALIAFAVALAARARSQGVRRAGRRMARERAAGRTSRPGL